MDYIFHTVMVLIDLNILYVYTNKKLFITNNINLA